MEQYSLWNRIPQQIRETCENLDHIWMNRRRRSDTFSIVSSILKLISGDDNSYLSTLRELAESGEPLSASSFCEARNKVPAYVFAEVLHDLNELVDSIKLRINRWQGFRVFATDGSKLNIPRPLEEEGFYRNPNEYYPQGLLTVLYEIDGRTIRGVDFSEQFNERESAARLMEDLGDGDLVIYDRGFLSYQFLHEHLLKGVHGLFRIQSGRTFKEIRSFQESSHQDLIVTINPMKLTKRKSQKAFGSTFIPAIQLRLLKTKIGEKEYYFATTCLRQDIAANDFIELYRERWKIEELYKVFKQRLKIETFHSKNRNGIEQELYAACILWNLSRILENFVPAKAFKKTRGMPINIALPDQFYSGTSSLFLNLERFPFKVQISDQTSI